MSRIVPMAVAAVIVASFVPARAVAQQPFPSEIFVGFQWIHRESLDLVGGLGEFAYYTNDWFGVGGELCWATGNPIEGELWSTLIFVAGPRFRIVNRSAVTPSVRAMAGAWQFRARGTSKTYFATTLGGAVDIRANDRVAVRLQPDVVLIYSGGDAEHFFRFAGGAVFSF